MRRSELELRAVLEESLTDFHRAYALVEHMTKNDDLRALRAHLDEMRRLIDMTQFAINDLTLP